jgi:uncharacterized iron-regulated protein
VVKRSLLVASSVAVLLAPVPARAQHPAVDSTRTVVEGADFRVYDGAGGSRSFAEVVAAMADADAVLVGETHDAVVGHGVETQLLIRAAQRVGALGDTTGTGRQVVLSMEMFERDVQYIVDEYLHGLITEEQFQKSARPWDRYDTDYRPMVEFARAHELPVVAANAPRRYVNRVSRLGPQSLYALSDLARSYLPPLPYPGPSAAYTAQWNALMADMMKEAQGAAPDSTAPGGGSAQEAPTEPHPEPGAETPPPPVHDMSNALQAQALWDAAMGEAVARALQEHLGALVIHYAGSFHVERGTGIPERVADYRPGTRILTIVLAPAEDIDGWKQDEDEGLGDFVILTRKPPEVASGG